MDVKKTILDEGEAILRKPNLREIVPMSDVTIWRMEREGKFPRRILIGGNSVGWLKSEILAWIRERAEARG